MTRIVTQFPDFDATLRQGKEDGKFFDPTKNIVLTEKEKKAYKKASGVQDIFYFIEDVSCPFCQKSTLVAYGGVDPGHCHGWFSMGCANGDCLSNIKSDNPMFFDEEVQRLKKKGLLL
jgi:hypothetical protein